MGKCAKNKAPPAGNASAIDSGLQTRLSLRGMWWWPTTCLLGTAEVLGITQRCKTTVTSSHPVTACFAPLMQDSVRLDEAQAALHDTADELAGLQSALEAARERYAQQLSRCVPASTLPKRLASPVCAAEG